jgi:nicotinamidase-related amidase
VNESSAEEIRPPGSLVEAADSIFLVVDAQPGFLGKLEPSTADAIVARIAWLVRVADHLGIPIVVTEEEPDHNGPTDPRIAESLPGGVVAMRKEVFGLADQEDILAAVAAAGRRTAILVGLETDVCVTHSALGLAARGYRVAVIADATGSPGDAHLGGLQRMRDGGVLVTTAKGIYYEWIRTVARAYQVEAATRPPGDVGL